MKNVWLYRLQQRLGLPEQEARVLLGLSLMLLAALGLRPFLHTPPPITEATYAATDSAFAAAATTPPSLSTPPDTTYVPGVTAARQPASLRLNLTTATAHELEQLPRIGPALAARIVAYRTTHGPFRRAQDITRVAGIGPKTYAQLAPHVTTD